MATPDGTTRKLPFSLSSTEDMESIVGSEVLAHVDLSTWSESDPDVKTLIVLNLSLNEYIALASTIDVGRDIAFGDHSIFIWWLWVRSLESMTICDAIIACINDPDSGVADAIINISNTNTSILNYGQSQSGLLFADGNNVGCSKDVWYGGIENLVNAMDTNNVDALQILEVATNVGEWVANVVGGIFGLEAPIIQSAMDWANFIQDNILENYEAQVTQQYLETVICDLLCIAMENCELTPQMLVDYFFGRLSSQLTFSSLLTESLEFLVLGVWTGTEIVDAFMLSQLVFRAQLGHWFQDIAFNSIDVDIRLGFDNASNDWTLICDSCGVTYTITFDDLTNADWTITADVFSGTVIIAPIIQDTFGNPQPSALSARYESGTPNFGLSLMVRVELTTVKTVESVNFDYYYTTPYANNTLGRRAILRDVNENQLSIYINTGNNAPKTQWNTVDGSPNNPVSNVKFIDISLQVSSQADSTYANCRGWIDNIIIGVT